MTDRGFDASIVRKTSHRPWPMPDRPWVMTQTWHDLLFAHWPVHPASVRPKVPSAFALDLFDGMAWLGIVPFRMTNVAPRGFPALPGISAFPELNVRTYVRVDDRPGVYFFSLDASSRLAVRMARALFNLPYHAAAIDVSSVGGRVDFRCARQSVAPAALDVGYEPCGTPLTAARGSLEYFLTERYCLYHLDRTDAPYRLEIHHPPWSLQRVRVDFGLNSMATAQGLSVAGPPAAAHFSARQDVVAWMPSPLEDPTDPRLTTPAVAPLDRPQPQAVL